MNNRTQAVAFQHVLIFDGTKILPHDTVVMQNGAITAIGDATIIPPDADIIDGTGQTLLPGLIDAHTHIIFGTALKQALIFGVTTELDMFTDYHVIQSLKQQQHGDSGSSIADLRSAGILATAPGGHGTEYGLPIPTLTKPEEAEAFVEARLAEGSDYIKIVYDDGSTFGFTTPTLDKATMAALVEAAHKHGKLAIVHIMSYAQAYDALEVGADALAHLFVDCSPDADFGRFVAEKQAFVIPTLTVLESVCGIPTGASLATDSHLQPYLSKEDKAYLQRSFSGFAANASQHYTAAEETVRQLKAAGVPILAGTDAPNPGTLHGASIHRELELLVQAGLTPTEALAAATSVPAAIFGLADRGTLVPGLRADVLLVQGDPTQDITATRAITGIWKEGVHLNREAYKAEIAQQQAKTQEIAPPEGSEDGLVSDFEDGTTSTRFGFGWDISADSIRGGKSQAQIQVVEGGANNSKGSLLITGTIVPSTTYSWAGAMFFPGTARWTPANLSSKKELAFWAKGDGQTYRVIFYASSLSSMPATITFQTSDEWQEHHIQLSQLQGIDTKEVLGILFTAGPGAGTFAFQIDDVLFS